MENNIVAKRKLPYWLRGGIIGSVFGILVSIVLSLFYSAAFFDDALYSFRYVFRFGGILEIIGELISFALIPAGVGVITGFIYGKIKHKK